MTCLIKNKITRYYSTGDDAKKKSLSKQVYLKMIKLRSQISPFFKKNILDQKDN